MDETHLSYLLDSVAARRPDGPAVEDGRGRTTTYAGLARAADRLATRLGRWGVGRGDRVGLLLAQGPEAVAAAHGVLRSGAAYVPADPAATARAAAIFVHAGVKAVVTVAEAADGLRRHWPGPGPSPRLILIGAGAADPGDATWGDVMADDAPSPLPPARAADDLAYVIDTAGPSGGRPRGVMVSHSNALAALDVCGRAFDLDADDRIASPAPMHTGLSAFGLFASCRAGAALVLAGEEQEPGRDPGWLARFVSDRRVSVWHSSPRALSRLSRCGGRAPRLVLTAGRAFPIEPLKRLRALWPGAAVWNLYGSTETNVCAAMPVPRVIPEGRTAPLPIGRVCPPSRARVVDSHGRDVPPGTPGELVVAGPGVTRGYFGRPDLTARAFLDGGGPPGTRWYRTGDLVTDDGTGCLVPHGRRRRTVPREADPGAALVAMRSS